MRVRFTVSGVVRTDIVGPDLLSSLLILACAAGLVLDVVLGEPEYYRLEEGSLECELEYIKS